MPDRGVLDNLSPYPTTFDTKRVASSSSNELGSCKNFGYDIKTAEKTSKYAP